MVALQALQEAIQAQALQDREAALVLPTAQLLPLSALSLVTASVLHTGQEGQAVDQGCPVGGEGEMGTVPGGEGEVQYNFET